MQAPRFTKDRVACIAGKPCSHKSSPPTSPVPTDLAPTINPLATERLCLPYPRSDGTEDNSNGLLLRRWLRSSRGVAPKKLR